MSKKIFIFILMTILLAGLVLADWGIDNFKQFEKSGKYGKIEVWDYGFFTKNLKLIEHTLEFNTDECLVDCYATGTSTLYTSGKLFSELNFKNRQGRNIDINQFKVYVNEKEYAGETLTAGTYNWKIEGKKDAEEDVDWIPTSFGEDLDEWAWWSSNWNLRKQVTLVGGTQTLTDFTVLINVSYTNMQPDFDDLRFVDGSCTGTQDTELSYEISNMTQSSYALVWVKIPSLATGTADTICMYYNNSAATSSESTNAWDSDYVAVYHLEDNTDSKGEHNLTEVGGITYEKGKIGLAPHFDGSSDLLTATDSDDFTISRYGNLTIEAYINFDTVGVVKGALSHYSATDRWELYNADTDDFTYIISNGTITRTTQWGTFKTKSGAWYYLSTRRRTDTPDIVLRNSSVSGNWNTGSTIDSEINPSSVLYVGNASDNLMDGYIDEVRISNVKRSSAWINRSFDNSNFTTFSFGSEESKPTNSSYTQTATKSTVWQGENVTFSLYVNMSGSIPVTTAYFYYNNTGYSPTNTKSGSTWYNFTRVLTIPTRFGNSTGISYSWYWKYNITDTENVTTSSQTQTVYNLGLDDCSTHSIEILNGSLRDEKTDVIPTDVNGVTKNSTIEIDLSLISKTDSAIKTTYNNTYTNETTFRVCISNDLNASTSEYWLESVIKFDMTGYVEEYYYLENYTIKNTTTATPKYIYLRDLELTDSTSFILEFVDESGIQVVDAIISILRKYVSEGKFKEAENTKTNNDGEGIAHLIEEDVIYKFNITKAGQRLFTSQEYKVYCVAGEECRIIIDASREIEDFPTDWDRMPDGSYKITSNRSSRTVTLEFTMDTTHKINLTLFEFLANSSSYVVGTNTTTASSGTLNIFVPYAYKNKTYYVNLFYDDDWIAAEWIDMSETLRDYGGEYIGAFFAGLIILTLSLMAVSKGEHLVIFAILGLIISSMLFLLDVVYILIIYTTIAGLIIIIKIAIKGS